MRNAQKDAIEMARKRRALLDSAYQLFSERSIESVKLTEVAERAGIGIASLYRYFPNKADLAIQIAADRWNKLWAQVEHDRPQETVPYFSAAQRMEFFLERFIIVFEQERDLLCLCSNFESYVRHEAIGQEQLKPYFEAMEPMRERMRRMYERAIEDCTVRTDIGEEEIFYTSLYSMQALANQYAEGVIWPAVGIEDMVRALRRQKEMILNMCLTEKGKAQLRSIGLM